MSYVTLQAAKVKEMCEEMLDRIEKDKDQQRRNVILSMMRADEASWWRKLWNQPSKTYQQMERQYLSSTGNHERFYWTEWGIKMYAWGSKQAAERLLLLSQMGDPVNVSSEDLWLIK